MFSHWANNNFFISSNRRLYLQKKLFLVYFLRYFFFTSSPTWRYNSFFIFKVDSQVFLFCTYQVLYIKISLSHLCNSIFTSPSDFFYKYLKTKKWIMILLFLLTQRCPGQCWVKMSIVQERAVSRWALSWTVLSQDEHCPRQGCVKLSAVRDRSQDEHCPRQDWVKRALSGTVLSQDEHWPRQGESRWVLSGTGVHMSIVQDRTELIRGLSGTVLS